MFGNYLGGSDADDADDLTVFVAADDAERTVKGIGCVVACSAAIVSIDKPDAAKTMHPAYLPQEAALKRNRILAAY